MNRKIRNIDSIIFDLDGTLWNSKEIIARAWTEVLKKKNYSKKEISSDELTSYMGKPIQEIGRGFFPDLNEEDRIELLKACCNNTNEYLEKRGAYLYDDLERMLMEISKKYSLFIVSNCDEGYIESFLNHYDYWRYFKDIECCGRTGLSKGENIKEIIIRNNLKKSVYVGDTQGDADACKIAGVDFVFAKYGYGNVDGYDYIINNLDELIKILD